MTGRGRSRRAKSPDPAEKLKGSTKEQKLKEEETTANANKSQRTSRQDLNASVQGARAKAVTGNAKPPANGSKRIQPVKAEAPANDPPKTNKTSKSGKPESPQFVEKRTTPKDVTETTKITGEQACGAEAKTQTTNKKDARNDSKPGPGRSKSQEKCEDRAEGECILNTTLRKLLIKMNDKEKAAKVVNEIKTHIIQYLKKNSHYFSEVEEPLCTGSYYENVKISNPDEFDVMLPIPLERANLTRFGDDGAFYSVKLKREKTPLKNFVVEGDVLSACKMLEEFRKEVRKCVQALPNWKLSEKKKGCPAVTFTTTVDSVTISLDVVLCLMVKSSWPDFTRDGLRIEAWLSRKVKQNYKRKPFYLVPKYEGRGTAEKDGVLTKDAWRISFSHIEKEILKNHGSEKTCCERDGEHCCRKSCLKLLKHLLSLLKKNDSSFDKICSYHAKTTLLHACCSRNKDSHWRASNLRECFQLLLKDFICHLEKCELPNFFIPSQNLLSGVTQKSCRSLAARIREELDNDFPVFKSQP